jgi:hypothetical protein
MALAMAGLANRVNAGQKHLPGLFQPCTLKKGCQTGLVCLYSRPITGPYGYYCFPA